MMAAFFILEVLLLIYPQKTISELTISLNESDYQMELKQVLHFWSVCPPYKHMEEYATGASNCELEKQYKKVIGCTQMLSDYVYNDYANDAVAVWDRSNSADIGVTSCNYEIIQLPVSMSQFKRDQVALHLRIIQSNCFSEFEGSQGGSSFEALLQSDRLFNCEIFDQFDDSYDVICPSRYDVNSVANNKQFATSHSEFDVDVAMKHIFPQGCANISVVVDYEHFDAFALQGSNFLNSLAWKPLRRQIIKNKQICLNFRKSISENEPENNKFTVIESNFNKFNKAKLSASALSAGAWTHATSILPEVIELQTVSEGTAIATKQFNEYNASNNYLFSSGDNGLWKWEWKHDPNYASRVNVMECVQKRNLVFVGESHSRYNWDALIISLPDPNAKAFIANIDRKHPASVFNNLEYKDAVFARNIANAIDSICDNIEVTRDSRNHTVILQWGAWDVAYFSLDYTFKDTRSADAVIKMLEFVSKRQCFKQIKFIFLSNVPYPHCQMDDKLIEQVPRWKRSKRCVNDRGCRNNYKIAALNEYFEKHIFRLNFRDFQFIDAFSILSPRLQFQEYVCTNHYMCRDDDSPGVILATPGGAVVVEAIQRAICKASQF